ncbi:uncharacterized protein LOC141729658 [Zonotrichia albicollis]|uniref:uncharacterized protein LOC141729658 n=1 Tax=Zonotrichia albicollis TaxID=44394 RepID=UPI003D80EFE3
MKNIQGAFPFLRRAAMGVFSLLGPIGAKPAIIQWPPFIAAGQIGPDGSHRAVWVKPGREPRWMAIGARRGGGGARRRQLQSSSRGKYRQDLTHAAAASRNGQQEEEEEEEEEKRSLVCWSADGAGASVLPRAPGDSRFGFDIRGPLSRQRLSGVLGLVMGFFICMPTPTFPPLHHAGYHPPGSSRVPLNKKRNSQPSTTGCHQRGCKAVPEAELPKDLLAALLMPGKQKTVPSTNSDSGCKLEESEFYSIHGVANEPQHLQEGSAAAVPHLPGAQEASWHKQGDATCERAVSADVENGFCTRDGSVREPLAPQGTAATGNERKKNLRRLLGERFRCHPVGTAVLILLLLVLVLALGAALAVLAAPQVPVTPATPLLVLGCPHGWVGYNGVCFYFSRDYSTWEQGQERCSELGASLAIAKDEEAMDLLFRLHGNVDFWLGLRRRGERLQWRDGSSYSSQVPVLGNSQCVYLADRKSFRSGNCSNERPYLCSKTQAPL